MLRFGGYQHAGDGRIFEKETEPPAIPFQVHYSNPGGVYFGDRIFKDGPIPREALEYSGELGVQDGAAGKGLFGFVFRVRIGTIHCPALQHLQGGAIAARGLARPGHPD